MGKISFTYQLNHQNIEAKNIIGEIEFGTTFSLYNNREVAIYPKYDSIHWINKCIVSDNILLIEVEDSFFTEDIVFDKILTTFLFNLLDFGKLKLVSVDFSKSFLANNFPNPFPKIKNTPALGTILKPYYQSLNDKKEMVSQLAECGLRVIKEDETFLVPKDQILRHSVELQYLFNEKGFYIPNITSYVADYPFIERLINDAGVGIVMINFLVCGLGNVFRLKKNFPNLGIWGHRVGYSAIENYISIQAISQMAVTAGIDYLHIGTPESQSFFEEKQRLIKNLNGVRPFKAVFTKTTETTIHKLVTTFKDEVIYLACGSLRNIDGISLDIKRVQNWVRNARS